MHQVSARIILPIILLIIGIVLVWCYYKPSLTDPVMLTGLALIVAGAHGIWLEAENRNHSHDH